MNSGIQVFNAFGVEIINSNDPMPFVFARGSRYVSPNFYETSIPYSGLPESPVIMIRPVSGYWYGSPYIMYRGGNTVTFSIYDFVNQVSPPCEWAAVASAKAANTNPSEKFGIETFNEEGVTTFSSARLFPRIISIESIKGPYTDGRGNVINTSAQVQGGFSSMPWIVLSDFKSTRSFPSNVDGASSESFAFNISSDFRTMNARLSDSVSPQYNQFQNSNMRIPMCVIPGA